MNAGALLDLDEYLYSERPKSVSTFVFVMYLFRIFIKVSNKLCIEKK